MTRLALSPIPTRYIVEDGRRVVMIRLGGPVRLSEQSCEELLDIWDREGAAREFNALYDAHLKAGGIPRVTSLRRVA